MSSSASTISSKGVLCSPKTTAWHCPMALLTRIRKRSKATRLRFCGMIMLNWENCFRMSLSQSEQHLLEFINLDSSLQELVSEHHSVKRDIHVVATSRRTQMTCNVRSTVACQTAFDIKEEVLLSATKTITLQFL